MLEVIAGFLLWSVVGASGAVAQSGVQSHAQPASRRNIVLIMADDLGQETLGCYGGTSYQTPHLDRLARDGMRFEHCYAMPVCHPTRVCLLTGRYPFRMGHPRWGTFPKNAESQTFAWALKKAGYATAVAGKWQLTLLGKDPEHPHRLGFDEYALFGWHEGPRYHDPLIWQNGKLRQDTQGRFGPDLYVEFLIDFISRHKGQPFLVYYPMALCHDVTDDLKAPVPYPPGKNRYLNYQEMVQSMDQAVGRLVAALDRLGLRNRTIILFTGDNGTASRSIIRATQSGQNKYRYIRDPVVSQFGDQAIPGGKGTLRDAGTRVPLIVNWPGTTPQGQVAQDLIDLSDFFPTLIDLAGASQRQLNTRQPGHTQPGQANSAQRATQAKKPAAMPLDGVSFAARLRGESWEGRRWVFAEHKGRRWVRNRRWKLYQDGNLFDLQSDPQERHPHQPAEAPSEAQQEIQLLDSVLDQLSTQR